MTLLLALPGQAMAQSSSNATNQAYEDASITVVGVADRGDPADPADPGDGGGTLPFSGLDVALLAASGGGLLLFGVGMRRLTRRPNAA